MIGLKKGRKMASQISFAYNPNIDELKMALTACGYDSPYEAHNAAKLGRAQIWTHKALGVKCKIELAHGGFAAVMFWEQ